MLAHHCKILVVRFDLHLHDWTDNNKPISDFQRKLRQRLRRSYKLKRMGYVWCREQVRGNSQHYHCAVIVDANRIQYPHKLLCLIDEVWQGWGHPQPYTPKNCYYTVCRDDSKAYQEVFDRLSYIAKVDTKQNRLATTSDYQASRIKPKK
jgi:Inovirus Gp2